MTPEQRQLYQSYLDSGEIRSIIDGKLQIFVGLTNLRKICNHPDLFDGGPPGCKKGVIDSCETNGLTTYLNILFFRLQTAMILNYDLDAVKDQGNCSSSIRF